MIPDGKNKKRKGRFTDLGLAISKGYIYPHIRKRMIGLGAIVCLSILVYVMIDQTMMDGHLLSSGPLSSHHSSFESNCSSCHSDFAPLASAKCQACHEKSADQQGLYSYKSHYAVKMKPVRAKEVARLEEMCSACHREHLGRNAAIAEVSDNECTVCHKFGSFNKKHPQFAFIVKNLADDSALQFSHILHVEMVKSAEGIASDEIERTCLVCHNPVDEGKSFAPLNYEKHCSDCHLPVSKPGQSPTANKPVHRDARILAGLKSIQFMLDRLAREKQADRTLFYSESMRLLNQVGTLAKECKGCHTIPEAQIQPVQKDQRVLQRTKFNHKPHTLIKNCLDCHTKIPMTPDMLAKTASNAANDQSKTLNIPGIESCQQCHAPAATSNRCIQCHDFHPK